MRRAISLFEEFEMIDSTSKQRVYCSIFLLFLTDRR